MLLYAPDFFLVIPGLVMLLLGLGLSAALLGGPLHIGGLTLNLYTMLLGLVLTILGYSALQLGVLAEVHYNFDPGFRERMLHTVTIGRGALAAAGLILVGVVLDTILVVNWIRGGFELNAISYYGVFGLLLIVVGFQTFTFTILIQMLGRRGGSRAA